MFKKRIEYTISHTKKPEYKIPFYIEVDDKFMILANKMNIPPEQLDKFMEETKKFEEENPEYKNLLRESIKFTKKGNLTDLLIILEEQNIHSRYYQKYTSIVDEKEYSFRIQIDNVQYFENGVLKEKQEPHIPTYIEQIDNIQIPGNSPLDISEYVFECLYEELVEEGFPKSMKILLKEYIRYNISRKGKKFFNMGYYHAIFLIEEIFLAIEDEEPLPWRTNGGTFVLRDCIDSGDFIEK